MTTATLAEVEAEEWEVEIQYLIEHIEEKKDRLNSIEQEQFDLQSEIEELETEFAKLRQQSESKPFEFGLPVSISTITIAD
jgi:uncharacterized protein YlxW (UPF0749 family)